MLIALVIIGIVCVLSNGIPMKIGGIANDGYNILSISTEDEYAIIFKNNYDNIYNYYN